MIKTEGKQLTLEFTTGTENKTPPANGNGYGHLTGEWARFYKITSYFVWHIPYDDREDWLHDTMLEMAKVKAKYEAKGKLLTEASLMRVASYELKGYWDKRRYRLFGLNCTHCTTEQRRECRTTRLPSECPKGKARRILSVDRAVGRDGGNELREFIPDDKATDLDARLDARQILQRLPKRLVFIGKKVDSGIPLTRKEKDYLRHWRTEKLATFLRREARAEPTVVDHLEERILDILRQHEEGMPRRELCVRLWITVRELDRYLVPLIKDRQVIEVKRENCRGRPRSPLLVIAGAPIPEQKMVKREMMAKIRHAYFVEGKSIKQIKRELHHDKRTVRRAIAVSPAPASAQMRG